MTLTYSLLRNLYAGQEAMVKTGHGTIDWFQIGKGVCQGCMLSPCLFNLRASLVAQLVRNLPAVQGTLFWFLGRKICWRRDRLPTPVFLGFPGGSTGKESTCNVGRPGFSPRVAKIPLEKGTATHSRILAWRIIYMQNTWCEMPGWMNHKLESRLMGEISTISYMQMIPPLWQKVKRN